MPDATNPQAALEAEFDTLMARAGIAVPPALRSGALAAFADLRSQLPLLHAPMKHAEEPAHVFRAALR
jgi:hypothetical protein